MKDSFASGLTWIGVSNPANIDRDSLVRERSWKLEGCKLITSAVYSDRREWEPAVPDIQEVIIVDGVDTIPSRMFSRLSLLTYVSFPDTVTTIGEYAFDDCTRLTSVDLPDGIKVIDRYAISDCWSLANMVLPEALTEIGIRAFRSCAMKEINIPENVNKIASEAFYKCTSLEKIIFAGAAPQIDENAFRRVTATVYYPAGNDTWTEDVMSCSSPSSRGNMLTEGKLSMASACLLAMALKSHALTGSICCSPLFLRQSHCLSLYHC